MIVSLFSYTSTLCVNELTDLSVTVSFEGYQHNCVQEPACRPFCIGMYILYNAWLLYEPNGKKKKKSLFFSKLPKGVSVARINNPEIKSKSSWLIITSSQKLTKIKHSAPLQCFRTEIKL